ncbi:MAG: hypothetical protein KAV87_59445 [Desulfobacteraceae bacterium]|nr:hypothetical protein [Desulfobacteraceae bacterium]
MSHLEILLAISCSFNLIAGFIFLGYYLSEASKKKKNAKDKYPPVPDDVILLNKKE